MPPRLGFVHIPKSGGTSVANAIFAAYGQKQVHISDLVDWSATPHHRERWGPHDVIRHHVSYRLARDAPFLSGHITYSDMKELGREVIFSVLRDPYAVALSHFTYHLGRASNPKTLVRLPHLKRYHTLDLSTYLEDAEPGHFLSALGKDMLSEKKVIRIAEQTPDALAADQPLQKKINAALKRFHIIMAGDLSRQIRSLSACLDIGDITIGHQNPSKAGLSFRLGAPRQVILDHLERLCWLDWHVYARSTALFPDTVVPLVPDVEKTFDAFVARFRPQA